MPQILDPNDKQPGQGDEGESITPAQLRNINIDYDYPQGLDLRPGHDLHEELKEEILMRARESARAMNYRHEDWERIDKNLKAYVYQPDTSRFDGRTVDDDEEDHMRNRVVMPVSYAMMETILAYFTTAFMKEPVFEYEGTGPEDVVSAKLLTKVVEKHVRRNAVGLALHTAWRDMFAYGIGVASPTWNVEVGKTTVLEDVGFLNRLRNVFTKTDERRTESEYQVVSEGNDLFNVDPYRYLPDPNVAAHEVQDGEFVGWLDRSNLHSLMRQEAAPGSDFFNVKYLQHMDGESGLQHNLSGRQDGDDEKNTHANNPVDTVWMYVDLIPSQWELGDSDQPEKWVFAVAADEVIIQAQPVGLVHEKFPVVVGAPDYDGYSISPPSKMAAVKELQSIIDFLYTSHIENVKRVVNDSLVVDPSLVNIHDVNDNKPGKIIRMRKKAWGQGGISEAIEQLEVQDYTQQNVQEAQVLQQFAQQATGATDNVLGRLPDRSSRISAREIQGVRSSSLSRLERPARIVSMQFMLPLARMFAEQTQQLMERSAFVKLAGSTREEMIKRFGVEPNNNRVEVDPLQIVGDYDVTPHDATFPSEGNGQLWVELLNILGQAPQVAQRLDMVRVFEHIAEELGATNVQRFIKDEPPQVARNERVQEEVRKGNAVPVEEAAEAAPSGNGRA